jgi:hypothetical protein
MTSMKTKMNNKEIQCFKIRLKVNLGRKLMKMEIWKLKSDNKKRMVIL